MVESMILSAKATRCADLQSKSIDSVELDRPSAIFEWHFDCCGDEVGNRSDTEAVPVPIGYRLTAVAVQLRAALETSSTRREAPARCPRSPDPPAEPSGIAGRPGRCRSPVSENRWDPSGV